MRFRPLPSAELLHDRLSYDPSTGKLTWKMSKTRHERGNRRWANTPASHVSDKGYLMVRLDGALYLASRVIWKMMTGKDPVDEIDHESRDRADNRWVNLRAADRSLQLHNKSYRRKAKLPPNIHRSKEGTYYVRVQRGSVRLYRGSISTLKEAVDLRETFSKQLYG